MLNYGCVKRLVIKKIVNLKNVLYFIDNSKNVCVC